MVRAHWSPDLILTDDEVVRSHGKRWAIETCFTVAKRLLAFLGNIRAVPMRPWAGSDTHGWHWRPGRRRTRGPLATCFMGSAEPRIGGHHLWMGRGPNSRRVCGEAPGRFRTHGSANRPPLCAISGPCAGVSTRSPGAHGINRISESQLSQSGQDFQVVLALRNSRALYHFSVDNHIFVVSSLNLPAPRPTNQ